MNETVLQAIIAHIFGHKYYANIINTRGTNKVELTCFIFPTRQDADAHRRQLEATMSFLYVETISFRSRNRYGFNNTEHLLPNFILPE